MQDYPLTIPGQFTMMAPCPPVVPLGTQSLMKVYLNECKKYRVRPNKTVVRILLDAEQQLLQRLSPREDGSSLGVSPNVGPIGAGADVPEEPTYMEEEQVEDVYEEMESQDGLLEEQVAEASAAEESSSSNNLPAWAQDLPVQEGPEGPTEEEDAAGLNESSDDPEDHFPWESDVQGTDLLAITTSPTHVVEVSSAFQQHDSCTDKVQDGLEESGENVGTTEELEAIEDEETKEGPVPDGASDEQEDPTGHTPSSEPLRPFQGAEGDEHSSGVGHLISNGVVSWTEKTGNLEEEHWLGEGITELSFAHALLGRRGVLPVLAIIEHSQRTLERLDLSNNQLDNRAVKKLSRLLATGFPNLRVVDIRGNPFTYRAAKHLAWMCEGVPHLAQMPPNLLLSGVPGRCSAGFHVMNHNEGSRAVPVEYASNRSPSSTRVEGEPPFETTPYDIIVAVRSNFQVGHDNVIEEVYFDGSLIPEALVRCVQKRISDAMYRRDQRKKLLKSYIQMECMLSIDPISNSSSQQNIKVSTGSQHGAADSAGGEAAAQLSPYRRDEEAPFPMRRGSVGELSTGSSSSKISSRVRDIDRRLAGADGLTAIYLQYVEREPISTAADRQAQLIMGSLHCDNTGGTSGRESLGTGKDAESTPPPTDAVQEATPNPDGRTQILDGSMIGPSDECPIRPSTSSPSMVTPERLGGDTLTAPGGLHQYYATLESSHCSRGSGMKRDTGSLREERKGNSKASKKKGNHRTGRLQEGGNNSSGMDFDETDDDDEESTDDVGSHSPSANRSNLDSPRNGILHGVPISDVRGSVDNDSRSLRSGMGADDDDDAASGHRDIPNDNCFSIPNGSIRSFDTTKGDHHSDYGSASSRPQKGRGISGKMRTARVMEQVSTEDSISTDFQQRLSSRRSGGNSGRKGKSGKEKIGGKGKKRNGRSGPVGDVETSESLLPSTLTDADSMVPSSRDLVGSSVPSERHQNQTLPYSNVESSVSGRIPKGLRGGGGESGAYPICMDLSYPKDDGAGGAGAIHSSRHPAVPGTPYAGEKESARRGDSHENDYGDHHHHTRRPTSGHGAQHSHQKSGGNRVGSADRNIRSRNGPIGHSSGDQRGAMQYDNEGHESADGHWGGSRDGSTKYNGGNSENGREGGHYTNQQHEEVHDGRRGGPLDGHGEGTNAMGYYSADAHDCTHHDDQQLGGNRVCSADRNIRSRNGPIGHSSGDQRGAMQYDNEGHESADGHWGGSRDGSTKYNGGNSEGGHYTNQQHGEVHDGRRGGPLDGHGEGTNAMGYYSGDGRDSTEHDAQQNPERLNASRDGPTGNNGGDGVMAYDGRCMDGGRSSGSTGRSLENGSVPTDGGVPYMSYGARRRSGSEGVVGQLYGDTDVKDGFFSARHLNSGSDATNGPSTDGWIPNGSYGKDGSGRRDISGSRERIRSTGLPSDWNDNSLGGEVPGGFRLGLVPGGSRDSSGRFISNSQNTDPSIRSAEHLLSPGGTKLSGVVDGDSNSLPPRPAPGRVGGVSSSELDGYDMVDGREDEDHTDADSPNCGIHGERVRTQEGEGGRNRNCGGSPPGTAYPASEQLRPPYTGGPFSSSQSRTPNSSPYRHGARPVLPGMDGEERRKDIDNAKFSVSDVWGSSPVSTRNQLYDSNATSSESVHSRHMSPFSRRTHSIGIRESTDPRDTENNFVRGRSSGPEDMVRAHSPTILSNGNASIQSEDKEGRIVAESPVLKSKSEQTPLYVKLLASRASARSREATALDSESCIPKFDKLVTDCWGSFV